MFKKIFISYASEDYLKAKELFDFLLDNNLEPWLAKEKLHVGSNWNLEIKQALKNSDFVIILLSSASIRKRGYVQREYKLALNYLQEKLIDDIYILPILLDDCEVPFQLTSIQWVRSSEENVFRKVLNAINIQRKRYYETTPQDIIDLENSFISQELEIIGELKKHVDIQIEYPVFAKNNFWNVDMVNSLTKSKAIEVRNDLYNFYFSDKEYFEWDGIEFRGCSLTYNISIITESRLSILFTYDNYLGGAHPNTYYYTLNFLFNPDYVIDPKIFFNDSDIKNIISSLKYRSYQYHEQEDIDDDDYYEFDIGYHIEDCNYNIEFTMTNSYIELILSNNLPRAIQVCGFFTIPYKIVDHKLVLELN